MITVPAAIMQPIQAAFVALNADQGAKLDQYFSDDAVVVDEVSPFRWMGSHAASRWWKSVDEAVQKEAHAKSVHANLESVTEYQLDREGDDAYVTVSMNVNPVNSKRKPEEGLWVLTLHRTSSTWKITSASWATLPESK